LADGAPGIDPAPPVACESSAILISTDTSDVKTGCGIVFILFK
jgi:hypothetical protein